MDESTSRLTPLQWLIAIIAAIMPSVEPQVTVISLSGSISMPR